MIAALAFAILPMAPPTLPRGIDCSEAALTKTFVAALTAADHNEVDSAKALIDPDLVCPAQSRPAYGLHALRAGIAVREADWRGARSALEGLGGDYDRPLGREAAFLALRSDQGLNDSRQFARDRANLVASEVAALTRLGKAVESFDVSDAHVDAFETPIDQGPFHRVYEFIITPKDVHGYPIAVQLTNDRAVDDFNYKKAPLKSFATSQTYFFDRYTCRQQSALGMIPVPAGASPPKYDEIKGKIFSGRAIWNPVEDTPPPKDFCHTYTWMTPGLGEGR